mmetsp:Transcript_27161/g.64994  ORF Transcript_27161/g.64994 Transcript_27161/m.64994 type:complete len:102 (+) Transcript_27161:839-1144(+)
MEGYEHYMRKVMNYSDSFVKRVLKHSKLMLAGQEIKYRSWPDGVTFRCNFLHRTDEQQQKQSSPTSSSSSSSSPPSPGRSKPWSELLMSDLRRCLPSSCCW